MLWGLLYPHQREVLRPYVVGKTTHELLGLGAERVIAVDRLPRDSDDPRIEQHTSLFEEYKATIETAFVSWPHPKVSALTPLVPTYSARHHPRQGG